MTSTHCHPTHVNPNFFKSYSAVDPGGLIRTVEESLSVFNRPIFMYPYPSPHYRCLEEIAALLIGEILPTFYRLRSIDKLTTIKSRLIANMDRLQLTHPYNHDRSGGYAEVSASSSMLWDEVLEDKQIAHARHTKELLDYKGQNKEDYEDSAIHSIMFRSLLMVDDMIILIGSNQDSINKDAGNADQADGKHGHKHHKVHKNGSSRDGDRKNKKYPSHNSASSTNDNNAIPAAVPVRSRQRIREEEMKDTQAKREFIYPLVGLVSELIMYGGTSQFLRPSNRAEVVRITAKMTVLFELVDAHILTRHVEWTVVLKIVLLLEQAGEKLEDGSKSTHAAQCALRDACEVLSSFSCVRYFRNLTQSEDQEYARDEEDSTLYVAPELCLVAQLVTLLPRGEGGSDRGGNTGVGVFIRELRQWILHSLAVAKGDGRQGQGTLVARTGETDTAGNSINVADPDYLSSLLASMGYDDENYSEQDFQKDLSQGEARNLLEQILAQLAEVEI